MRKIFKAILTCLFLALMLNCISFASDDKEVQNIWKEMRDWEYPETLKKERDEIFEVFEEFENEGFTHYNDLTSVKYSWGKFKKILKKDTDGIIFEYYGALKDNCPNGKGILLSAGYPVFAGNFKKGKLDGYGMVIDIRYGIIAEGTECKLSVDKFRVSGEGILYQVGEDGTPRSKWERKIKEQLENIDINIGADSSLATVENEKFVVKPAVLYEGELKDNKKYGEGKIYYDIFQSLENGEIVQTNDSCYGHLRYDGEFKDDTYNGKGILYFYDGTTCYNGQFKKGKYNGKGCLYDEAGNIIYEGKFKNGDIA